MLDALRGCKDHLQLAGKSDAEGAGLNGMMARILLGGT
jgi:hypothetical protein